MKNITKTILYLQMAAMLATVAFAGPKAAEKPLPFRGTIEANEVFTIIEPPFTHFLINGIGTGTATHLGRYTVTYEWDVEVTATGSAEFIAANGDSIFTDSVNNLDSSTADPLVHFLVETHIITGGTGRFSAATGSFTLERFVMLTIGDVITDVTSGSFEGTISY